MEKAYYDLKLDSVLNYSPRYCNTLFWFTDWSPSAQSLNPWRPNDHSPNGTEVRMGWNPYKTNVEITEVRMTVVHIGLKSKWD